MIPEDHDTPRRPTYLWVHLNTALQYTLGPHIRRAAREDSPEPVGGQPHHERLDTVGRDGNNTITLPDALGMIHGSRQRRGAGPELPPRALAHRGPALADLGDGDPGIVLVQLGAVALRVRGGPRVQNVLGEAERHALEPPGHLVDGGGLVHHAAVAAAVDEVAELEEAVPEVGALVDGVVVELAECLLWERVSTGQSWAGV